ncbi:MAG: ribosome-binding factor A [Patescibacteria group bacterium]|nr:ribosome-binding factor A [Patescibacteria group bacterium]
MSKRNEQVAELLRSAINSILQKEFEPPHGILVNVSEVNVSPDLKKATAYVSVLPQDKSGSGLEAVRRFSGRVQREMGRYLKMQNTPQLIWELDDRDLKYKAIDEALSR